LADFGFQVCRTSQVSQQLQIPRTLSVRVMLCYADLHLIAAVWLVI